MAERYPTALLAHHTLTPGACGALALAIEDALDIVAGWDVRVDLSGRFPMARAHLRSVEASGSFGRTKQELDRTAHAVMLANDLYAITRALRGDRNDYAVSEFVPILGGSLDGTTRDHRPYEAQSQLWFTTLLAHANTRPALLDLPHRRPDALVEVEGVRMSFEIKRPQNLTSVEAAMRKAAAQIHAIRYPGFIVVDATEIVRQAVSDIEPQSPGASRADVNREAFRMVAAHLHRHLTERQGAAGQDDPRWAVFHRVIGLVVFSRHCVWAEDAASHLDFGYLLDARMVDTTVAAIYGHHGERFLRRLARGVAQMTGNPMQPL